MSIVRYIDRIKDNIKSHLNRESLLPPINLPKSHDTESLAMLKHYHEKEGVRVIYRTSMEGQLIHVIKRRQASPMTAKELQAKQLPVHMPQVRLRKTASLNEQELLQFSGDAFDKLSPITTNADIVSHIKNEIAKLRRESSSRMNTLRRTPSQVSIKAARKTPIRAVPTRSRSERRLC
mmetsp:Transcript_33436/g.58589  ORF Transcript_33436/g.58589 Transcript_33436/m.58589 type:complete len:178 (+) Transcript_33436:13-546(+)